MGINNTDADSDGHRASKEARKGCPPRTPRTWLPVAQAEAWGDRPNKPHSRRRFSTAHAPMWLKRLWHGQLATATHRASTMSGLMPLLRLPRPPPPLQRLLPAPISESGIGPRTSGRDLLTNLSDVARQRSGAPSARWTRLATHKLRDPTAATNKPVPGGPPGDASAQEMGAVCFCRCSQGVSSPQGSCRRPGGEAWKQEA